MDKRTFNESLGAEIRRTRESKGISANQLARAIGCSWQQLADYEKGKVSLTAYRLAEIRSFLDAQKVSHPSA